MATPLLAKLPTCPSCVMRSRGLLGNGSGVGSTSGTSAALLRPGSGFVAGLPAWQGQHQQTRGKKHGRPRDRGVVVRLLEDIPTFGRKDSIFRTDRGRMRNVWYPNKKAEYMTAARFAELGLSARDDVGERDVLFGLSGWSSSTAVQGGSEDVGQATAAGVSVQGISPERAATLLTTLLPARLIFERKPIQQQQQPSTSISSSETSSSTPPPTSHQPLAIFGSVSTDDVAALVRERLRAGGDPEAALIRVEARDVRFLGVEREGAGAGAAALPVDRVKSLGRWEVEISVRGSEAGGGAPGVEPVRKLVEVVAQH